MKDVKAWGPNRRSFLRSATALAGGSMLAGSGGVFSPLKAFAQKIPCPPPPTGGTPFVAGSDTRPIQLRQSVSSLSAAQLTTLQNAFAALRNTTDNRGWMAQAYLHAYYCESCLNSTIDVHGSWAFFPWHRAYVYYLERILGSLVGDLDNFRLPYWDWENVRSLPPQYLTPNSTSNSLWDANRNSGIAAGGNLPATDATQSRIDTLYMITDFATSVETPPRTVRLGVIRTGASMRTSDYPRRRKLTWAVLHMRRATPSSGRTTAISTKFGADGTTWLPAADSPPAITPTPPTPAS